jgi:hypothetical protein
MTLALPMKTQDLLEPNSGCAPSICSLVAQPAHSYSYSISLPKTGQHKSDRWRVIDEPAECKDRAAERNSAARIRHSI